MTAIFLYDDARARQFEPFALTRPLSEVRAGAELIRRRWTRALGLPAAGFIGAPHLVDFDELDAPSAVTIDRLPAGTVLVNTRCAVALTELPPGGDVWRCEGRVAAVRLADDTSVSTWVDGTRALESLVPDGAAEVAIDGWWMDEIWDLIRALPAMLASDIRALAPAIERAVPSGVTTIGEHDVIIERGAHIEPMVLLDASDGPILIRAGARVAAFTRLVGPCGIGEETTVGGGRVAACAIGERCRVHGELSNTIFIGHANKAHDGFVGHSIVGRWANLGAATVTSNLKNTYGTVALWTPGGQRDTGMQFLGAMIGDHAKLAIGTRVTTGCVIGAGANVFCDGLTSKLIPPFTWGTQENGDAHALEKFLAVAARVMARRQVVLSERARRALSDAYANRWHAQ